jgi:hypothetical protein
MKRMTLYFYLAAAAIITIFCGLVYGSVQQGYRSGANDPQIQVTADIREHLEQGRSIERFFSPDSIDLEKSLAVFSVLYDNQGKPLRSSGILNGRLPQLPSGVFAHALAQGSDWITWQPQTGVRMAMVVQATHFGNAAFVASGRSLQEVELREHRLVVMVLVAWLFCLGVLVLTGIFHFFASRQ